MNTDIRKLTYSPRKVAKSAGGLLGELPPSLRKPEATNSPAMTDVRLEARIRTLEREREESERLHRETLAAAQESAVQHSAAALREQEERLMREAMEPLREAVQSFLKRQEMYFRQAEEAVIRLSLNIAARILNREAQMDPLILRGAARVALDDVHAGAVCVLEVAESQKAAWERWIEEQMLPVSIELRSLPEAPQGHCRIEIGESTADLSVESQLAEIERGFFDLLQRRTGTEAHP